MDLTPLGTPRITPRTFGDVGQESSSRCDWPILKLVINPPSQRLLTPLSAQE